MWFDCALVKAGNHQSGWVVINTTRDDAMGYHRSYETKIRSKINSLCDKASAVAYITLETFPHIYENSKHNKKKKIFVGASNTSR